MLTIKEATPNDLESIIDIETKAFQSEEEAQLVIDLQNDPTAQPMLSLLAWDGKKAIGHILFTKAGLKTQPEIKAYLLAPMAVLPNYQKKGIGQKLIYAGFEILEQQGVDLVFVLGHPTFYPKVGFLNNAGFLGFEAPYPIPDQHANAWMVKYLVENLMFMKDQVICAKTFDKPELWVE